MNPLKLLPLFEESGYCDIGGLCSIDNDINSTHFSHPESLLLSIPYDDDNTQNSNASLAVEIRRDMGIHVLDTGYWYEDFEPSVSARLSMKKKW